MLDIPIFEERAARTLATGIAQSKVTTIYFFGTGERPHQQERIWRILFDGIRSLPRLQRLEFTRVAAEVLLVVRDSISSLPSLQNLRVVLVEGGEYHLALSQILMRTSSLISFGLNVKYLGELGLSLLAHGLRCNTSVTDLRLAGSKIDDPRLELFLELWQPTSPIRELSLSINDISLRGAQQLLRTVACHTAMQVLDLSYNKKIGYDGLIMIGEELLNQTNLTELNVSGCGIWIEHPDPNCELARVQYKALQLAGQSFLKAVKQNVRIKKINVSGQRLPPEVENEIAFYANLNYMGRYLLSTDHGLVSTVWCYILAKCHQSKRVVDNNESLIYYFLCAQPSLAEQASRKRRRSSVA
jgi:hypothetical protein